MDDFFDPLEETPLPPFEYMMMLARKEKADTIRKTLHEKRSAKPVKEERVVDNTPMAFGRVKRNK